MPRQLSKFQTKLEEADEFEPRFAQEIQPFPEALPIKLADVDDYFNTCGPCSQISQFFHFRFVNEVLYPLAVTVLGLQEAALALANKALKIQNPVAGERCLKVIKELVDEAKLARTTERCAALVAEAGITAEVRPVVRTPYEVFIKGGKKEPDKRLERLWVLAREQDFIERISASVDTTEIRRESPPLSLRDVVYYDILVEDEADCIKAKRALARVFRSDPKRGRDFIAFPKPNQYRAMHEEYTDPEDRAHSFRVRIFSGEMDRTNRLGLAGQIYTARGLRPLASPFLTKGVLEMVRGQDRETRRLLLGRLPEVRQVRVQVTNSELVGIPKDFSLNVWRGDTLLDVVTLAHPRLALMLDGALSGNLRWGRSSRLLDPRKSFDWFSGQEIAIVLGTSWSGYDLYSYLRNPLARRKLRYFISSFSPVEQVAIGRQMMKVACREARAKGGRVSLSAIEKAIWERGYILTDALERETFALFYRGGNYTSPQGLYYEIARGNISALVAAGIAG